MKTYRYFTKIFASFLLLCTIAVCSCSKDDAGGAITPDKPDAPTDTTKTDTTQTDTTKTDTATTDKGVIADRPTNWNVIADIDPTTSMTLTIEVTGLPQEVADGDMMSSFVGSECRGVTSPVTQYGITRFYLPVARSLADDPDNPPMVTLYYYSAKAGRIYTSATNIQFERDGRYGTIEQPYQPVWK